MKKKLLGLLTLLSSTMVLSACSLLDGLSGLIPLPEDNGQGTNSGEQSSYACPSCSESFVDQPDHDGPCVYEAETCKLCQRDVMLDYVANYQAHGATRDDPIPLSSEQELISLIHFVHLNRVTKFFKCNYEITDFFSMNDYLGEVFAKATDANCTRHYYGYDSDRTGYLKNTNEQFEGNYTKKSEVDYEEKLSPEFENAIDELFLGNGDRDNDFNQFKIYNRKYELNVQTGDDLFYACTHGYKPKAVAGSNAETILIKIKEILRENIKDSMTDFEKAFTMYCWLIKNVQYDNGAVQVTDYGEFRGENNQLAAWGIEGSIFEHKAICDSLSKAYAVFMGMENIKCIQVSGNSHAWNKIHLNLDGEYKWYVVDPTWGNAEIGDYEDACHSEFLYNDAIKSKKHYTADNYLDCPASEDINQYKYIKYDGVHDWFIENDLELNSYLSHIGNKVKELHNAGKTVSVEICYPTTYEPLHTVLRGALSEHCGWDPGLSIRFSESAYSGYKVYNYQYEA